MLKNGAVILSTAHDIVRNLSFEDWLYRNIKCTQLDLNFLLMWRNGPAVVIGRHQNPWLECNLHHITENGVKLVRRNSGGGTVYHDMGNLNFSFFTPRRKYNRDLNLNIICEALKHWNLDICVSERHDLLWNGHKISGTASKLGSENAYHHCTLLLNVNRKTLHQALQNKIDGVTSKATKSIRSSVQNLSEVHPSLREEEVMLEVARQYQQLYQTNAEGPTLVDPSEKSYPGIQSAMTDLQSWEWVFGRTPRFQVARSFFPVPAPHPSRTVHITVSVYHGVIEAVILDPGEWHVLPPLKDTRFVLEDVEEKLNDWIREAQPCQQCLAKFLASCCLKMVKDICIPASSVKSHTDQI